MPDRFTSYVCVIFKRNAPWRQRGAAGIRRPPRHSPAAPATAAAPPIRSTAAPCPAAALPGAPLPVPKVLAAAPAEIVMAYERGRYITDAVARSSVPRPGAACCSRMSSAGAMSRSNIIQYDRKHNRTHLCQWLDAPAEWPHIHRRRHSREILDMGSETPQNLSGICLRDLPSAAALRPG